MSQTPINRLPYANIVDLEVDSLTAGSAVISSGSMVLSSLTVGTLEVTSTATIAAGQVSSAWTVTGPFTANNTVTLGSNSSDVINANGTFQGLTSSGITTSTLTVTSSATIAAGEVTSNWQVGRIIASSGTVVLSSATIGDLLVSNDLFVSDDFSVDGDSILGDNVLDTVNMRAGSFTRPNMPAFFAYNSVTDTNVTGNSTAVTVDFNVEVYDRGGNFGGDTFVAPYTAIYHFDSGVTISGITSNHTLRQLVFNTTSIGIVGNILEISSASVGNAITVSGAVDVLLSSGNTINMVLTVSGASSGIDVVGSTVAYLTWFSGHMIG